MNIHFNLPKAVLLLTTIGILSSCSEDKKEETTKEHSVLVHTGTARLYSGEEITVSGQVQSRETVTISTRVMGLISSVKVKPGDLVQKGQLLITINNEDMLAKRAQTQAMVSESEAALLDAQKDYERFEDLYQRQSSSKKEFENATLRYNSVKAKAEAARQARNEVDAMLAYTSLVAPFAGIVTQKNVDEGNMANPGMPLLVVEQLNNYDVSAFVTEDEVSKLKIGMVADVTIKSSGITITGIVSEISPSSQFSGGQFQIKVTIRDDQNAGLHSGIHVTVNIPFKNNDVQSLLVPASAIIRKDQLSGLYTISDSKAQLRWLKVGKTRGDEVEILSGLGPKEAFIVQSLGRLYNGVSVEVK